MRWVLENTRDIAEIFSDGASEVVAAEVNKSQIGQEPKPVGIDPLIWLCWIRKRKKEVQLAKMLGKGVSLFDKSRSLTNLLSCRGLEGLDGPENQQTNPDYPSPISHLLPLNFLPFISSGNRNFWTGTQFWKAKSFIKKLTTKYPYNLNKINVIHTW